MYNNSIIPVCVALALISVSGLQAQDLNQRIEVTNNYRTKMEDFGKVVPEMTVPDTLYNFNLDFDYSVFKNPYKGGYEFEPYVINVEHGPAETGERHFFLRAGAGYALHPVLQTVFSPELDGAFGLTLFEDFGGYVGQYRDYGPGLTWNGEGWIGGYDISGSAGAVARLSSERFNMKLKAAYEGAFAGAADETSVMHSGFGEFTMFPTAAEDDSFLRGARLLYRYTGDRYAAPAGDSFLGESYIVLSGSFAPGVLNNITDVTLELAELGRDGSMFNLHFNPRFAIDVQGFVISLGADLAAGLNSGANRLYLIPDCQVSYGLDQAGLTLYAGAGGGVTMRTLGGLARFDHRFSASYCPDGGILGNTAERLDAFIGVRGAALSHLQYDVRAGFKCVEGGLVEGIRTIGAADWNAPYADFKARWKDGQFDIDAHVNYTAVDIDKTEYFTPARLTGGVKALYSWRNRLSAGVTTDFCGARYSTAGTMPWYVDLGLQAEFKLTGKLTVWARGTNLLNKEIQIHPGFCERGLGVTAGVCLSL